jgi:aspartate aminotransferase-like enzyme
MFPDDQVKAIADAAHSVGAVFVLDCIASGTYWVDMKALGIDVVITAPQKGWSGHACAGKFIFISVVLRAIRMTPCFGFCSQASSCSPRAPRLSSATNRRRGATA